MPTPQKHNSVLERTVKEGIRCPHCNCGYCPVRHTEIREITFRGKKLVMVRRKRVCQHCNVPFTTVETPESEDVLGLPAIVESFTEQLEAIKEANPGRTGLLLPDKTRSSPKKTPPPVKNPY